MSWYRSGSISLTNGSAAVTGAGTAWILNASVGEALLAPDGKLYEISAIASDTSITLATAYLGATQAGQAYVLVPTQSYIRDLAAQAAALVNTYSSIANNAGAGKFGDGAVAAPGVTFAGDQDTGFFRSANNEVTFVANGVAQFKYSATGGVQFLSTSVDINGGTIDGAVIGGTAPAAGTFTALRATSVLTAGPSIRASGGVGTLAAPAYTTLDFLGFDGRRTGVVRSSDRSIDVAAGGGLEFLVNADMTADVLTLAATLDAAGRLGLGVAPSVWGWPFKGIDIIGNGAVAATVSGLGDTTITHNAYYNGVNWAYKYSGGAASRFRVNEAGSAWFSAPPGNAGDPISFTQVMTLDASGLRPGTDNTQSLGDASYRWSTVFAGTGMINTSDAREKTAVSQLSEAELNAAKQLSKEIGIYKFLDSVATKGDAARKHVGLTVQRAIEIMEGNGLDPFSYGFICYDEWDQQTIERPAVEAVEAQGAWVETIEHEAELGEEGNTVVEAWTETIEHPAIEAVEAKEAWTEVTREAGDRFGFRYDQLNLFIIRGIDARLSALEAA